MNLSHAVTIVCWEFFRAFERLNNSFTNYNKNNFDLPTFGEFNFFFKNLEEKLQVARFFHSDDMKINVMKNIISSEIIFLSPIEVKDKNIIKIPDNLSPNNSILNHIKRLFW